MKANDKVIGREDLKNEISQLYKTLDKSILLVKGPAGIGKTFAIKNILKTYPDIKVIACKQQKQLIKEFSLVTNLIDKMMEQILSLPTEEFNPLTYQIKNNLGTELGYVAYLGNSASGVFPDIKIKEIKDYSRQKYIVRKALVNFVKTISNNLDNVYIYLDDIHWADESSLDMVKALIKDKSIKARFILSYRDEFTDLSKEEKTYGFLDLFPLREEEVKEMIIEQTSKELVSADYLTRYISSITLGNPFYIIKVIDEFLSKRVIEYKNEAYKVHLNKLVKSNVSENINEIMLSRITELNREEKRLLEYLACYGGDIYKEYFEKTYGEKSHKVINSLIKKSFIFITDERYSFTHDIILEDVYKEIDIKQRENIYYKIAKDLTGFYKSDKSLWPLLVTAIINSRNLDWDKKTREEWFEVLSEARNRNINYREMRDILILCKSIMAKEAKLYNEEILFKLANCYYLLGDREGAETIYKAMKEISRDSNQMLKVKAREMRMFSYSGNHQEAMTIGIEMLEILGIEYNVNKMEDLIKNLDTNYSLDALDNLLDNSKDQDDIDELYILYSMIPSARILDGSSFKYILLLISSLGLKKSKSRYRIFAISACSFIMFNVLDNYKIGKELSDIVVKNIDFNSEEEFIQETIAFYLTFVHHWSNSIYETISLLEKNNGVCLEKGYINYFEYSLASLMFAYYVTGKNMYQASFFIEERINKLDLASIEGKYFINTYVKSTFENFLDNIKNTKEIHLSSKDIQFENLVDLWFSIIANYISNYGENVYRVIKLMQDRLAEIKGHIIYVDSIFLSTLIMLEHHENLTREKQALDKAIIDENIVLLKNITSNYEENHLARYYLIKGMYQRAFGDKELAIGYINKGISLANDKSNFLLLAIANRLGAICNSMPELKNFYAFESLKALGKYTSDSSEEITTQKSEAEENTKNYLILQSMEAMGDRDAIKYFLDNIAQKKRCSYAGLLVNEANNYMLAYEKKDKLPTIEHSPFKKIEDIRFIVKDQIIMSKRTSNMIINNKESDQDQIIITLPIKLFGVDIGMLYLESTSHNQKDLLDLINLALPYLIYRLDNLNKVDYNKCSSNNNNTLTTREVEILKHLFRGDTNQRISELESISVGTVKSHLSNIYTKLGVENRRKAIIAAKDQDII